MNLPGTQPVSGSVALAAGSAAIGTVSVTALPSLPAGSNAIGSVSVSNLPATQPVSAAALPLPTGAATAANQAAPGTAGTPSAAVLSVQGVAGGAAQPVSGTLTVQGGAATGSPPAVPPVPVSGVDGSGNKQHLRTDATGALVMVPLARHLHEPGRHDRGGRHGSAGRGGECQPQGLHDQEPGDRDGTALLRRHRHRLRRLLRPPRRQRLHLAHRHDPDRRNQRVRRHDGARIQHGGVPVMRFLLAALLLLAGPAAAQFSGGGSAPCPTASTSTAGCVTTQAVTAGTGSPTTATALIDSAGNTWTLAQIAAIIGTPAETLAISTITAPAASTAFAVPGTYTNGPPAALDYSDDGGTTWAAASSPTIGSGAYTFSHPGLAAGTYTVKVRDHTSTSIIATSNSFTIAAAASPWTVGTTGGNGDAFGVPLTASLAFSGATNVAVPEWDFYVWKTSDHTLPSHVYVAFTRSPGRRTDVGHRAEPVWFQLP